ncbi:MAG: biotin/lipoyl-binding protein, partial [Gammaproteobacteria bacterium]
MHRRLIAPILILVLAAAGGGWWYWQHSRADEASANRLLLYGNIDVRLVNLAFDAEGRIAEMSATEGSKVTQGELLAHLDTRRLELERNAAQADMATQQEQVKELEAGTRPEEIHKLEAELEAARARATNAERNYRRIRDLETKKLASPQQLD